MAIGCEEVSARMMELLYGELPADDRAAALAHVEACAACKAELAAFRATRVAARRALDADAPPARAHEAILRAAAAAVAARRPVEARPAPRRPSFWERVHGRWTLPTFATVGAVAVVVIASKVFLEPDRTVELGRQTVRSERTEAAPARAIAETPPTAAPAEAQGKPEPERGSGSTGSAPAQEWKRVAPQRQDDLPRAAEPPARSITPGSGGHRHQSSGYGAGLSGAGRGKGSAALDKAAPQPLDEPAEGLAARADRDREKAFGPPPAAPAKPAKREFAPPPPPRAQPAAAPVASADEVRAFEDKDSVARAAPPPTGGGAPAPAGAAGPQPAAHAKAKKAAEPAPPAENARAAPA